MSLATLALASLFATQDPQPETAPPPDAKTLIERFSRLDPAQRNTVVRNMERRLQRLNDDVLQGIMMFERATASYPAPSQPTWFLPSEYAPVAKARRLIAADTPAHRRATRRMEEFEFLPDLHAVVEFDWQLGKATYSGATLDDDQRFANYVNGYPPGTDHAIARVLEMLDRDEHQRQLAWFFEHLYADRYGGVYADVTMFDAWNSGVVIEMPDTEAIAYARRVLSTQSFVSPIPGDRRRARLYRKVKQGFASHRDYRSLRWVAAATLVVADPRLDATYQPLVRRCHWLWIQVDGDPAEFAARLARTPDRTDFLREIDDAIRASPEVVEGRLETLRSVAEYLRLLAAYELTAAEG